MGSQPALDLSSLLINVGRAELTPASQNSGNMLKQTPLPSTNSATLPISPVNLLEKAIMQGPSSVSEAAIRPEAQSSNNTVAQRQLSATTIVDQNELTPVPNSVARNSQPSQRSNSSVDIVPPQQLPTSVTVSQTASAMPVGGSFYMLSQRQISTPAANFPPSQAFNSFIGMVSPEQLPAPATNSLAAPTLPVNGSFNTLPQEQVPLFATNSVTLPSQSFYNSVNMEPHRQLATSSAIGSQMISRPVQPFVSGNTTSESQILRSAEVPAESFAQFNLFLQSVAQSSHTSFNSEQELEATRELHGSSSVSSAVVPHAFSSMAQSPNLNLLAQVTQVEREQCKRGRINYYNVCVRFFLMRVNNERYCEGVRRTCSWIKNLDNRYIYIEVSKYRLKPSYEV